MDNYKTIKYIENELNTISLNHYTVNTLEGNSFQNYYVTIKHDYEFINIKDFLKNLGAKKIRKVGNILCFYIEDVE